MKKTTLLSLAVATLLFTACGEETKKAAAEATQAVNVAAEKATEETKEKTAQAVEKVKEKTAAVTEAVKEKTAAATEAVKEKTSTATAAVKEAAEEASKAVKETTAKAVKATEEAVTSVTGNAQGEKVFAKCAGCHGKDGKTKALGKSEEIAGQAAADLESKIKEYKAGSRNVAGMGTLMKGQVSGLSDDDIKAVAAYISGL